MGSSASSSRDSGSGLAGFRVEEPTKRKPKPKPRPASKPKQAPTGNNTTKKAAKPSPARTPAKRVVPRRKKDKSSDKGPVDEGAFQTRKSSHRSRKSASDAEMKREHSVRRMAKHEAARAEANAHGGAGRWDEAMATLRALPGHDKWVVYLASQLLWRAVEQQREDAVRALLEEDGRADPAALVWGKMPLLHYAVLVCDGAQSRCGVVEALLEDATCLGSINSRVALADLTQTVEEQHAPNRALLLKVRVASSAALCEHFSQLGVVELALLAHSPWSFERVATAGPYVTRRLPYVPLAFMVLARFEASTGASTGSGSDAALELVKMLLDNERGAFKTNEALLNGQNGLAAAIAEGASVASVAELLEHPRCAEMIDGAQDGPVAWTPAVVAVGKHNAPMLELLLRFHPDLTQPSLTDTPGVLRTPFEAALAVEFQHIHLLGGRAASETPVGRLLRENSFSMQTVQHFHQHRVHTLEDARMLNEENLRELKVGAIMERKRLAALLGIDELAEVPVATVVIDDEDHADKHHRKGSDQDDQEDDD